VTLTFDLLTLKVVSESRVTWATSVPILVFLGVLDLGPMYATVVRRQTDVRQKHRLMPPPIRGGGIITYQFHCSTNRNSNSQSDRTLEERCLKRGHIRVNPEIW